jgi:lipopolysaccharide export system permease protein
MLHIESPYKKKEKADSTFLPDAVEQKIKDEKSINVAPSKPGLQNSRNAGRQSTASLTKALDMSAESDSKPSRFVSLFNPSDIRQYAQRGKQYASTVLSNSERNQRIMDNLKMSRRKHIYEMHSKFSIAFVCIIFLFIGGPMGAIVRKGGYGYPLLIAIFFFTAFIILNIACKKLNESETLEPVVAAWMPCMLLAPIGIFLTLKAMNDSKLLDVDQYIKPIIKLFSKDLEVDEKTA